MPKTGRAYLKRLAVRKATRIIRAAWPKCPVHGLHALKADPTLTSFSCPRGHTFVMVGRRAVKP